MKKIAPLFVAAALIAAVFGVISPASADRKKCVGATPCLVCTSCEKCGYCKSGKKCGACRPVKSATAKPGLQKTLCEGVPIIGPKGTMLLPLPASDGQVETAFASVGLLYRNETAFDTVSGTMNVRYRLKFAYDYLMSVETDTVFAARAEAERFADSVTRSLRPAIASQDETMVAVGLGGHKTYYVPALVCGNRAINYVFTLVPDLAGKITTLTRTVTMTPLPTNK
jgi:hypothetical protein